MQLWDEMKSRSQQLAFLNGLIPMILITFIFLAGSFGVTGYFFPLGYLLYGWSELLALSTFVSVVPDVAFWYYNGIALVGAEKTAHITLTIFCFLGATMLTYGAIRSIDKPLEGGDTPGRSYWLLGGILTLPFGILGIVAYINSKSKDQDLSLRQRISGELRKNKLPYILIIPALVFLIFTYVVPIFRGFYITLFSYPENFPFGQNPAFHSVDYATDPLRWTIHAIFGGLQNQDPIFIGIDNFLELFSHSSNAVQFQNALENNIYYVIIFVPGVVIASLLLAVLLNSKFLKGENTYTTIFYMPVVTSILVVSVIWRRVVFDAKGGILTSLLNLTINLPVITDLTGVDFSIPGIIGGIYGIMNIITLGLVPANTIGENISWITDHLMESVAMMGIWRRVGFDVLILLAGLKSIPDSLYEAAEIDGHGSWSKFKNITIPMLKGPLGVVMILELINGWLVFQELYGLDVANYGGSQTLAVYLIGNYTNFEIMTFASTVGYFIFGMTAYLGLLGRMEIKNSLKIFPIFGLLAILFNIPSNRSTRIIPVNPKSLGFTLDWLTYDVLFLFLAFFIGFYYLYTSVIKRKELERDAKDLRKAGFFTLFIVPFYLVNGYSTLSKSAFGSTPFTIAGVEIRSLIFGVIFLIISLLMIFAPIIVSQLKKRRIFPFLFRNNQIGVGG